MSTLPWLHPDRVALLEQALHQRILILDGGMGTMLQAHELDESGFRGERFEHGHDGHAHEHAGDAFAHVVRPHVRDVHLQVRVHLARQVWQ